MYIYICLYFFDWARMRKQLYAREANNLFERHKIAYWYSDLAILRIFCFFLFFGCECFAMLIFFFWVHLFLNANFGMHNELNCVVCKRKIFVFDIGFDIE